jgi:hypothetical protein
MRAEESDFAGMENQTYEGRKTGLMRAEKPAPNNYIINNLIHSNRKGASKSPAPFGRYKNIFLSEAEYGQLKEKYPESF